MDAKPAPRSAEILREASMSTSTLAYLHSCLLYSHEGLIYCKMYVNGIKELDKYVDGKHMHRDTILSTQDSVRHASFGLRVSPPTESTVGFRHTITRVARRHVFK